MFDPNYCACVNVGVTIRFFTTGSKGGSDTPLSALSTDRHRVRVNAACLNEHLTVHTELCY